MFYFNRLLRGPLLVHHVAYNESDKDADALKMP
jgi:hypothetical protein